MADSRELWNRLEILLELAAVAVSGCGDPVSSWSVEYDDQVMDECDCENSTGHLFARVARIYPSGTNGSRFPQPSLAPNNCPVQLAADVDLGIYRCVANLDDNGAGPTPRRRAEDALRIARDASVLYNVLLAHNPVWANFPVVIRQWTPIESQGSCAGGKWSVSLDVDLCVCGPDTALYPSETLWPEDDLFPGGG